MSELDDVAADLFAAIEAVNDSPDLESDGPGDIVAHSAALGLAVSLLQQAVRRWEANARVALPDWEGHHPEPTRKKKR